MLFSKTNFAVSDEILKEAQAIIETMPHAHCLNHPTGDKLTDPWELNDEHKGTVWEKLLASINEPIGEARLIRLSPKQCYQKHTDPANRYHLNITGSDSYLIDLTSLQMYPYVNDKQWWYLDATIPHTAGNFGTTDRWHVIVVKLNPR